MMTAGLNVHRDYTWSTETTHGLQRLHMVYRDYTWSTETTYGLFGTANDLQFTTKFHTEKEWHQRRMSV